jgi:hypothetical protein
VLVAQDRRRAEVWARTGDAWSHSVHDAGSRAPLPSLDYQLDVDELYATAGVDVR